MRYLLTEHGSVLKFDEGLQKLSILVSENHWKEVIGYEVNLPKETLPPPPPPRDEDDGLESAAEQAQPESYFGTIQLADISTIITDCTLISDFTNAESLKQLWLDQKGRIDAGIRIQKLQSRPEQDETQLYAETLKHSQTKSYSYTKLLKFVDAEKAKLKKNPFIYKRREKLALIEAAESQLKSSEAIWRQDEASLARREKNAYIQLARESGLIDALNWHRFKNSGPAKRGEDTSTVKKLELECPGISKKI